MLTSDTTFTKRSHRPWKTNLLKELIQQTTDNHADIPTTYQILPEANHEQLPTAEHSRNKLTNQNINSYQQKPNTNAINLQLQSTLQEKNKEKEQILQEISNKDKSPLSIGGFFQPNCMPFQEHSTQGQKINVLMNDLKIREKEISSLTNNLKISQAIERAEQAEISRQMEEQARVSAEDRMKQAIEQANSAAEQFHIAMQKVEQAEYAQKEEEKARKIAEAHIKEALLHADNAQLSLETERQIRIAAEEKAQHALNQTVQIELSRQESEKNTKELEQQITIIMEKLVQTELDMTTEASSRITTEEKLQALYQEKTLLEQTLTEEKAVLEAQFAAAAERTRIETEEKLQNLYQEKAQLEQALAEERAVLEAQFAAAAEKTRIETEGKLQTLYQEKIQLEQDLAEEKAVLIKSIVEAKAKILELSTNLSIMEKQATEATNKITLAEIQRQQSLEQYDKLRNILQTEKDLRKLAEQKTQEAISQATNAEMARKAEEYQRKLIEERAKHAVERASKTMMHFLSTTSDNDTKEQLQNCSS